MSITCEETVKIMNPSFLTEDDSLPTIRFMHIREVYENKVPVSMSKNDFVKRLGYNSISSLYNCIQDRPYRKVPEGVLENLETLFGTEIYKQIMTEVHNNLLEKQKEIFNKIYPIPGKFLEKGTLIMLKEDLEAIIAEFDQ